MFLRAKDCSRVGMEGLARETVRKTKSRTTIEEKKYSVARNGPPPVVPLGRNREIPFRVERRSVPIPDRCSPGKERPITGPSYGAGLTPPDRSVKLSGFVNHQVC